MKTTWDTNSIQFPRLLAEVWAVLEYEQYRELAVSMDLSEDEVRSLFQRADEEWEAIKERLQRK